MILSPISYFISVTGVAECIANALEDNQANGTLGRPGRVCVIPGSEIVWDGCDCGQLAIAFQHGPYPVRRFPAETIADVEEGNCHIGSSGMRCIASITRCEYHPQGPSTGIPPTPEEQTNAALLQSIEGFYMLEAVSCCLAEQLRDGMIDDYRIGAVDRQVDGACGEVALIFWIGIL